MKTKLRRILSIFPLVGLAVFYVSSMPQQAFRQVSLLLPDSWDGASHRALSLKYSAIIFPDTFGWADGVFGGMPFPNFYPTAHSLIVALFYHTYIFSFGTAFKLSILIPLFLAPAAVWVFSKEISNGDTLIASSAAIFCGFLLSDSRFYLRLNAGIDFFSTFQLGLYSQLLGFVALILWLTFYLRTSRKKTRFGASTLLLALTILTNFFAAVAAFFFVAAATFYDLYKLLGRDENSKIRYEGNHLFYRLISVVIGVLLSLFWLGPMLRESEYLVTRPTPVNLINYLSPLLWGYCVVAILGCLYWQRRPTLGMWPYVGGCGGLAGSLLISSSLAPSWFPLQAPRLLAILIFLLSVPVGYALAAALTGLAKLIDELAGGDRKNSNPGKRYATAIAWTALLAAVLTSPGAGVQHSFYSPEEFSEIAEILSFAKGQRNGRYLVEVPPTRETKARFDGRAINAYLAEQGNETLSIAYHEASVNSLFFLPVINALSGAPYHFGISSILGDDLDFIGQPASKHLDRARRIGVRYLAIHTPQIKARLVQEPAIGNRRDFAEWSVFELKEPPAARARILPALPALVVSDFTVKERRRNESSFIRWAEEQFADNWFEVLLTRSPEKRLDRLPDLSGFGALVLDTYECGDCQQAFEKLREFTGKKALILLESEAPLYQRICAARGEFPKLELILRHKEPPGEKVNSSFPTYHYNATQIRRQWGEIRAALEKHKIPTIEASDQAVLANEEIPVETGKNLIDLKYDPGKKELGSRTLTPVLIATTFHPNWRRTDGEMIYAATPFYMLTFTKGPAALVFSRQWGDRVCLWISAVAFLGLVSFIVWPVLRRKLG